MSNRLCALQQRDFDQRLAAASNEIVARFVEICSAARMVCAVPTSK